jgi:lycopene cyclase domain-containing protein
MRLTYLLLDLAFGGVALLLVRKGLLDLKWRPAYLTVWLVSVLTLVFDNMIVYFDIVEYDASKTLGIWLPYAPIEDFGYTVIGAFLIPAIWHLTAKIGNRTSNKDGDN